ncbi:MAG: polyphosphate kinase 1, partial [Acidimicrobiaceae bacterium]|nr:polyphosphate kinase 1 [Acidimicrobiaceae bacterium]
MTNYLAEPDGGNGTGDSDPLARASTAHGGSGGAVAEDVAIEGAPAKDPASFGPERFLNRELSWLEFADRILDLADGPAQPLLERVKFLAIFSSGVDEFFQVRIAGLKDQLAAGVRTRSADGRTVREQLKVVRAKALELEARQAAIFAALVPQLAAEGICLTDYAPLDDEAKQQLSVIFERDIYPVLTPLAVDPGHPFPYISNLSLNLAVLVEDPLTHERRFARVKVPPLLPRFVPLPDGERYVPLEQVIAGNLGQLFPGMKLGAHYAFRVTRNADLELEDEGADDLLEAVEVELRRRRFGRAVRLEADPDVDKEVLDLLLRELELEPEDVYGAHAPLDLAQLWAITMQDRPDLLAPAWTPLTPPLLTTVADEPVDLFAVLRERDVLVQHPYESFASSVEAFISQAASDPDVLAIKQTLYRTSGDAPFVSMLARAADAGKQVAALVELKARFDEQRNIVWARRLEQAGVHVVYGLVGLKTHSKTALVVRREEDGIRRYCHIGTGNYNSDTAKVYEDIGLLTSDPDLGADLTDLFNHLTGFSRSVRSRSLILAPDRFRSWFLEEVALETEAGEAGHVVLKCNGLTDPEIIDSLYRASQAGARVELVVRSVCSLRPGVPGLSEGITVRSIVGRFLEHSRIYRFGEPDDEIRSLQAAGVCGDEP